MSLRLPYALVRLMLGAALGLAGQGLRRLLQRRAVRIACGLAILSFGALGMLRAFGGLPAGWMLELCLTPGAMP